ncbi:uncharacterized protein LOC143826018 [Paroedura picta]|uniref:uncharacterized protein LOC143826018 n=1 Tax=Paroedura picta TaxID=143630 RepID=UPI00405611C8
MTEKGFFLPEFLGEGQKKISDQKKECLFGSLAVGHWAADHQDKSLLSSVPLLNICKAAIWTKNLLNLYRSFPQKAFSWEQLLWRAITQTPKSSPHQTWKSGRGLKVITGNTNWWGNGCYSTSASYFFHRLLYIMKSTLTSLLSQQKYAACRCRYSADKERPVSSPDET